MGRTEYPGRPDTRLYKQDVHLLILQRLQNRELRVIRKFDTLWPVRKLLVTFQIPYVYDYKTKLYWARAEVIQNHVNPNIRGTWQAEAMHCK
jgi:hypothetical protein